MEEKRNYLKEFMAAFDKGMGFTWLTNYGHLLKHYEVVDIAKELIYAIQDAPYLLDIDKQDIKRIFHENMDEDDEE